jgi:HAD superfamily hydrolase (TIGR01549 family)
MDGLRVVSLDLDDTLWDMWPVIRRAETVLARWLRDRYPRVGQMFPPEAMRGLRATMIARYPDRRHDVSFLRRATLEHCFEVTGHDRLDAHAAFDVFMQERNRVELFDDVVPALERMARRFELIAVTNGNADLEKIGLAHFFEHVVSACKVGASKPSREIFDAALRRCGAAREQVMHVGDDLTADVEGALGAGLRAVWINRSGQRWPGDEDETPRHREVQSLRELADMLDAA